MKNFTFKNRIKILLSFILSTLFLNVYGGEGSKQTTTSTSNRASLCINSNEYGNFARYGSTDVQRLYIRIQNPSSEKVYLGFSRARRSSPTGDEITSRFRIIDPNGNVAFANYDLNGTTSNITGTEAQRLSRAQSGPVGVDGVTSSTGYTPIVFTPNAAMGAGDYYIEFQSTNDTSDQIFYNYYDITVANSSNNSIPGRIYSKRWAFAMDNVTTNFNGAFYVFAPDNGSTTGATTQNGFVNKINFNGAGFRPWYFNVAFNNTGPGTSGNTANDQKSVYNASDATKMSPKYEVFLNDPDINIWKNGTYDGNIKINGITNCGIGESNINISVNKSGTVEILLDFDGGDGVFTAGTKDVLTTQSVSGSGAPPYAVSVPWDGKDGLGNIIAQGTSIPIVVSFGQAAFHFPMYDVEENQNGFSCTVVRPAAPAGYVLKFYWDDRSITYNSGTFDAKLNLTGCTPNNTPPGNCHRWSGFDSNNNDDPQYGNMNTINTWWYANRDFVRANIVLPPFYTVALDTKTDVKCFGGSDGTIKIKVTNGTAPYKYYINGQTTENTLLSLAAGTYNIKVVDANGCSANVNGVVIGQPTVLSPSITSPTHVNCFGGNTGSATVTVTGGTSPYTYSWSPSGGTGATASNLTAGTYTVTVTDANSCTKTASVTINQPTAALSASITSPTHVNCFGGNTGSATVTVSGGTAPYTYSWSPSGGTGATASNLTAGTYTVTVKDANNCTTTATVKINQPDAALSASITSPTHVACFGGNTGSATVSVTGGTSPYTYSWSPSGGTGATASNLLAGTYTVTVKDANNCTTTATVKINQPDEALSASITSPTHVACFGGNTGSATVTITGGTSPYTYSWSPSGGTGATASNLLAGTYTVTVKDANNCTTTATVKINQPDAALSASITSPTHVACFGGNTGSATVSVTGGTSPYTYSWSPSGGTGATASNLLAGTYTVTVKDANNCTTTATVKINQPDEALSASITSPTHVACFGGNTGSATVTVTGGTSPYTYSWSPSGGTGATASNLLAGTYTVTVKDANNCTTTATVKINQPDEALSASITSPTHVACFGGNTGSATVTVTGGTSPYTYSWSPSGGTGATASNLTAGTYTVTVKDANNCTTTATVKINQPDAALSASITSPTHVNCFGGNTGSATVSVTGGTSPYTYSWSPSGGTGATASNLLAGTYTVTVKDTNNCTTTATVKINQPDAALSATKSQVNPSCGGATTGTASVEVSGGTSPYTYLWNTVPAQTGATATGLKAGNYSVTITDHLGCSITEHFEIIDGDSIIPVIDPLPATSTINCPAVPVFEQATASDLNGTISSLTYEDEVIPGQCEGAYTKIRTWYAKDACGNEAVPVSQTIIVQDNTAPTWTTMEGSLNKTVECSDEEALAAAQALYPAASDACDSDVTNIIKDSGRFVAIEGCGNAGTYTNTWTVTDACGNISETFTQVITIQDTKAPTWKTEDGSLDQTVECSDTETLDAAQALIPTAIDSCDTDVSNIKKVSGKFEASEGCTNAGTYTNTWTVTDDCGNTSGTFTQIITVRDTKAPTWETEAGSLDQTVECSDEEALAAAQTLYPAASDACDSDVTNIIKVSGKFEASEGCTNAGTYTNTWTVIDDCGNTSETFTQVITIKDSTAPTWDTKEGELNVTLQCSDTEGLNNAQNLSPIAKDNCDSDIKYTKTSGELQRGACGSTGTYTNTWVAEDNCGNTSTVFTQTITIQDTAAPKWITVAGSLNEKLECSDTAGLEAAQNRAPEATANCTIVTYEKISGPFVRSEGCANAGTYTNSWIAKDDCGNVTESFIQVITIEDTTAPTWQTETASLNRTVECSNTEELDSAQALFPTAFDACDTDVTNITKTSGEFIRSEGCANAGTYTNRWTVTDDCGNTSAEFVQVITIQDTTAPTWQTETASLDKTIECSNAEELDSAQALFPTAFDACDTDVTNITKVSGEFMATEGCANAGTYTNRWTVTDDCGNTSAEFVQVITIQDTTAPIWQTETASLNRTVECSNAEDLASAQALFPTAFDSCDTDVTNITKTSGEFIRSEGCANAGTYTNRWTVTDDCGNTSAEFVQVITIQDTTAPIWQTETASLDKTIECSNAEELASAQALFPTAFDSCDTDVTNITKVSGEFMATEGCANAGTYTNKWTVTDDCGNTSAEFVQVITIKDTTAPTWSTETGSLNRTVECSNSEDLGSAQALFPTASDSCDTDVTNITKVSGEFVASEGCANTGTYTNTWTVTDDCGNTSETFTQVITIQDTTAPTFAGELPGDITVSCDAVPEAANAQVSDNCNGDLPVVYTEVKSDIRNECGTEYTLTRTWTTSDCGGNTVSHTQIITVRDTTPPTGTAPADVAGLQNAADIPAANPADVTDASDNCGGPVNITVSDSNNGGSGCDGNAYIVTRTYTLTDCAGNKTELVQTFTVENKVSVSGVASNVTCLDGTDGSITVTSSPGATVVITNANNEVVGNTNLPAGTYTLTATSPVNAEGQTCTATATVTITQPNYKVKVSGQVINVDTNTPIANVPVTLIPQGSTPGPILIRITNADGQYTFSGMVAGDYLVQVQDANLNSAYQLYPVDSSLFFTTLEECKFQVHDFLYGKSNLPVLGDYVWYDTNNNGIQDEWYDANNDGVVTKNIPDSEGAIDYSLWEWIDFNGDGSYTGPMNAGELNAGGFGNALSSNVIVDGPNGYHDEVIVGIQGFWRNRPESENPYGEYTVKLVKDANFNAAAAALGATGLVKVLPTTSADKKTTAKTAKTQMHTVCTTTSAEGYVVNVTPEDLVHLDIDFGVSCKEVQDIVANDDNGGPFPGVNHTTPNVLNVLTNDTLEGQPVTASEVIITTVTPNEFLQLNPDGSVDILPNAPAGTLTMVYQICEADETSNCDTATVTITIEAPVMTVTATPTCVNDVPYLDYAVTDTNFTPVDGVTITWADSNNNVITTMTGLPLSGRVLWPGAVVDEAGNGIDWPGWVFQDNKWIQAPDGFETLRPTATLTISVNPSQTIVVNYPPADPFCIARPTFAIVANDDSAGPIPSGTGATNVLNVYPNDTLNGDPVNPSDVTLTTVTPDPTGALTLNPDGSVDVKVGTVGGTYTLTYQICENADFGNCDTAIVTVVVVDPAPPTPVAANDDLYNNIGCNTFGLVGNVLSNDLKGNVPATLELVNFTLLTGNQNSITDPNITVDTAGNVTVASLTPAGTYTYSYQICDKLSPDNCDTATITIVVNPVPETRVLSTACTDDSTLVDLLALLPAETPRTGTWVDVNNSNALQGNNVNPRGLALGLYIFEYRISDANCPRTVAVHMTINNDCQVLACENILVHNAFSPNGDQFNDVFVIDGIDDVTCYPENTVEIYNRWGILVFETTNYNNVTNNFDGTSRGRTTVKQSDGLPTGTYYYIVTYKSLDGNNVIQNNKKDGYLYLSK
ncbi:gliding motility-associated-like protein [Flavobacterium cutihirudinis]|uniref:Gliding motility-associated-like protein n=1 Tax=Flavobacterium cutihirudinis TaxID=1265740 RepID=A0A3D9FSC7_9FLAO|nr:gliding motility-associated C-terminal domain-containing protein [Flavobacterium cutihirudinis]RED23350.1 gliding motility-associated-like protein [Flavobacterium cutihirudinis]